MRATTTGPGPAEWGRRRLLAILVAAVAVGAVMVGGLVYAVQLGAASLDDPSRPSEDAAAVGGEADPAMGARGQQHRDEIAAAPMLSVPPDAMLPADPADEPAPSIAIPAGDTPGPAFVLTGFPHTPEGAIGQLAQIDMAVLQAMSKTTAAEVYQAWALPGGVGAERWWITTSVEAFLSSAAMGEVKDASASVAVEPASALVKGIDGPDWVTVCVLLKVTATYRQDGQVAAGHCERMQWVGGRWMIAPGTPPAPAPSTWPGTDLALEAGWRTWVSVQPDHGAEGSYP
jgi:hypothetical protein